MTAVDDVTAVDSPSPLDDLKVIDLDSLQAVFAAAAVVIDEASTDAELVDRMTQLASPRSSLEALQAAIEVSFARVHTARQIDAGETDPKHLERSIGAMIGKANRVSPTIGRNRMRVARDLHDGLHHVQRLHASGQISEYRAAIVEKATAHLDRSERAEVDRRLAERDVPGLGIGQLRNVVAKIVAEVAPEKFRDRARTARTERRVTIRQREDGMADFTAHLPVEQAVTCYAALHKAYNEAQVSREPLTRGRGQVMADVLVERVAGQATAEQIGIEVQVMVPVEALLDPSSPLPAEIPGFGPVPVELLTRATGRRTLRRLITRRGTVIGGDSQARCYPKGLGGLLSARDRARCTAPYCDALARQNDHIIRAADGGPTSFDDGRVVCELHNVRHEALFVPSGGEITPTTAHRSELLKLRAA